MLRSLRASLWLYLSLLALSLVWLLLERQGWLRPLENLAVDARFQARGPIEAPVRVVYVDIDTEAMELLGNFPWERSIFARLCEVLLKEGKAKAVGIDVVFSNTGVPNIADREKVARGNSILGRYLLSAPEVVLAASYAARGTRKLDDGTRLDEGMPLVSQGRRGRPPETPSFDIGGLVVKPPTIGLIDAQLGETRRVPLFAPTEERDYLHLSLELARLYRGLPREAMRIGKDRIEFTDTDGRVTDSIPLIDGQMADVNWFSRWADEERNPRASAAMVFTAARYLASSNPEAVAAGREFFDDGFFQDAIVLIGPVDPLLQDLAPTSFDASPVPKVGVHGNMVKTILSGRFLHATPDWALAPLTIGLAALVAGLFVGAEGRRSAVLRTGAMVLLAGYVAGAFWLFARWDMVLPLVAPVGAALSAAFVGGAAKLVLEQKQKSRIKGMFGAYLSPAVVAQMVNSRSEPRLGGVEEDITAFFSDVQSFSSFSEVLTPPQLVELMNEYLTACTDIVQAEGGTLDKYIGDAVVAMYGAPLALPDHALRACVAALRVQRRCAELRVKWRGEEAEKGWPAPVLRLRTRIGLNSGRAVVGNMGSTSRFSYTMMGDTVNLAARMESGAKAWGVYTLCAEPTMRACLAADPERVVFRALGRVVVKGRNAAVPVYELAGLREDVMDGMREVIARFEAGLAKYEARDWDGALADFAASAEGEWLKPDPAAGIFTNPSLVYRDIVAGLRANPPGPDWDGARVMTEK
jgi:adenylate cyclase